MSEVTTLEQVLLKSPAARARFLADSLEILRENGVDVESPAFQEYLRGALDISDGPSFLKGLQATTLAVAGGGQGGGAQTEGLQESGGFASRLGQAASSVVIVAASAGQRGAFGGQLGKAASSVVIVAASAGQRGAFGGQLGKAASSVVIVAASAGQRGAFGGQLGQAASSVVIVAASAGQRGALGGQLGQAASSVVIVAASAGQRGALGGLQESAPPPEQQGGIRVLVPAAATIEEIATGLRALADLLTLESESLATQIGEVVAQANQDNR